MAGPSDPAACPVCGPGFDVQPHRAAFPVLPSPAAQSQHVWCPGVLLQVGAEKRELVVGGPETHGCSPDPALPTVRMRQGAQRVPACWRHCWRRQDWRTPTCITAPKGEFLSLDLALF